MESDTTIGDVTAIRVAILKKARYYIENGNFCFICNAIVEAGEVLGAEKDADVLVAWIGTMLAPSTTYLNWVRANHPRLHHPELFSQLSVKQQAKKAKEGRLAWIDWMIQEVQS